jgi:AcrR family transcriptional regulator
MQPAVDFSPLRRAAGARALSVRQAAHDAEVTTLLEAAYRLIRRRGVVEPGVREVVAEAGLANRAFYRHFATKDAFWLVLVEDVQARLAAEVRAAVTPKLRADNKPGAWNRFVITLRGDRLSVALNGKTVIENAQLPGVRERGPIGLQHHGDPIEFANLYIKELN